MSRTLYSWGTLVALASSLLPGATRAQSSERVTTIADQVGVNLSVYNGGLALVHDRRRFEIGEGRNYVAWRDVSANMDATSALLESATAPGSLSVREQNLNYDVLTPASLLQKAVGHDVVVVHDRSSGKRAQRETAKLLSASDGIVLQYADRIETQLDGHIEYGALPAGWRDRPTLVLDLANRRAGPQNFDLSYLTRGIGWYADYVGTVSPDEKTVSLTGLVTLMNTSGTTYRDARVQLVAGRVNVAPEPSAPQLKAIGRVSMSENGMPAQENYFEYHLYTLARPTTVADNQTKQVTLLAAHGVPIRKTLELRGSESYYTNAGADLGTKLPVGVYETFANKGGDLGIPLPGGRVRLYKNDAHGTSQFLGSDTIDHTPRNEDVRLRVGDSFDVTAKKKQTDFKGGGCDFTSQYEIVVANAKSEAADVLVVEPIPGDWSIVNENRPHTKSSSASATWDVRVPANSRTALTYGAHVRFCP